MDYTKLLMLKVDDPEVILSRSQFLESYKILKMFPEYYNITKEKFKKWQTKI